jgi:hypothetical protein
VDRLVETHEGPAAQLLEVLAVGHHPLAPDRLVGDVGGGPAVELMEGALPEDAGGRDGGRLGQALGMAKLSSKPPSCSSILRGRKRQLLSTMPSNQSRSPMKCPISKSR